MASSLGSPHHRGSHGSNSSSDRSLDEEAGARPARAPRGNAPRNGRAMRLGTRRSAQEAVEQPLLQPKQDAEAAWGGDSDEVRAAVLIGPVGRTPPGAASLPVAGSCCAVAVPAPVRPACPAEPAESALPAHLQGIVFAKRRLPHPGVPGCWASF